VLNYPSKPYGKDRQAISLQGDSEASERDNLTVISDEVYDSYSFAPCPSILEGVRTGSS